MDKIIDDLLGAQKITMFKEKQRLVRLQWNAFLPARGAGRTALCVLLPRASSLCCAGGDWKPLLLKGWSLFSESMVSEKLNVLWFLWRISQRREIKRKLKEVIQILQEHKTSLRDHSYQSHRADVTYPRSLRVNTLEDGAESGMGAELCLGFQPEVLNANESLRQWRALFGSILSSFKKAPDGEREINPKCGCDVGLCY